MNFGLSADVVFIGDFRVDGVTADLIFDVTAVIVLGLVALHGLTYKDADGQRPLAHLLFGAIALLYAGKFLFGEILQIWWH